jgi:hypothetical protein
MYGMISAEHIAMELNSIDQRSSSLNYVYTILNILNYAYYLYSIETDITFWLSAIVHLLLENFTVLQSHRKLPLRL